MPDAIPVLITRGAEEDLRAIFRRRLAQRGAEGEDGAERLLAELISVIEALGTYPLRGPVPPELEVLGIATYRQISLPPFRVIYLPATEGAEPRLTVMLVADARRDFRALLEERVLRLG
ncbi:type II toxin-antitoxin system RelE/ParE family toxin [Novosphingobium sp.]|uniref:type II toxin-antitoxin system RelE/ParE family toxin n=1 Tax=Novosphingobium sp. TaxID=1874826 RepID=UPI00286DE0E7|nr:type II toxin-antitoxin system RelE/ParE family toxin [Novosphingobium sp.]